MLDKQKIDAYWQSRAEISDARVASSWDDGTRLRYDVSFCQKHMIKGGLLLDLGAGSCTLTQQLLPECQAAVAAEKVAGLLAKAPPCPGLTTICTDLNAFESSLLFDTILLFGVVNYLNPNEECALYKKCQRLLRPGGVFIVKNQCGIEQEVVVNKFSEQIGADYHARYPFVQEQMQNLSAYFAVTCHDIYPPACNPWPNTHFYAFVCQPHNVSA